MPLTMGAQCTALNHTVQDPATESDEHDTAVCCMMKFMEAEMKEVKGGDEGG